MFGILALILAIAVSVGAYFYLSKKADKLKGIEKKYGGIASKDEVLQKIDAQIKQSREINQKLQHQTSALQQQLQELEEQEVLQAHGFYESKYDFGTAENYKAQLDRIRGQQKEMIKNKTAAVCHIEWTVEGSRQKGRKMESNAIKLVLRAFNGECDTAVLKVKYNNATTLKKRIDKTYESLNKLTKVNHIEITPGYHQLKLQELYLTHEYQEKKQEELEEQRQIREQMREEEKARKELEKIQRDAEKEEQRYQDALEKARREVGQAAGKNRDKLQRQIEELQRRLEEAQANKERAISRAQLTRSGHVYIISNIGSFGDNVFKIGMTRRLEPSDRVRELSNASVPFPFDIHAMIFTEDAPGLESELHRRFDERRVNKANNRKEFFRVSLDELSKEVRAINPKAELKLTKVAEAVEWRKTLAMEGN